MSDAILHELSSTFRCELCGTVYVDGPVLNTTMLGTEQDDRLTIHFRLVAETVARHYLHGAP